MDDDDDDKTHKTQGLWPMKKSLVLIKGPLGATARIGSKKYYAAKSQTKANFKSFPFCSFHRIGPFRPSFLLSIHPARRAKARRTRRRTRRTISGIDGSGNGTTEILTFVSAGH
jgi:hypothetical protein